MGAITPSTVRRGARKPVPFPEGRHCDAAFFLVVDGCPTWSRPVAGLSHRGKVRWQKTCSVPWPSFRPSCAAWRGRPRKAAAKGPGIDIPDYLRHTLACPLGKTVQAMASRPPSIDPDRYMWTGRARPPFRAGRLARGVDRPGGKNRIKHTVLSREVACPWFLFPFVARQTIGPVRRLVPTAARRAPARQPRGAVKRFRARPGVVLVQPRQPAQGQRPGPPRRRMAGGGARWSATRGSFVDRTSRRTRHALHRRDDRGR